MKRFSFHYSLLTYKLDQLWFPLAFWALFVLLCLIERNAPQLMTIARAYLGGALPLIAGITAAYAVLDDPALELRFSTPVSVTRTLFERLGLIMLIQLISAGSFQIIIRLIGGDFSMYPSAFFLQLGWLLPTLALMALGCVCAFAAAQPTTGAMAVGLVWIVEVIARGWLAMNNGKYVLVFMGAFMPDHPDLVANHISVTLISICLYLVSWVLLRRQERYI